MPKNEIVVVDNQKITNEGFKREDLKTELKKEALVQGEQLLDKCLVGAKDHFSAYAEYAVRCMFDHLMDYLHDKFAA